MKKRLAGQGKKPTVSCGCGVTRRIFTYVDIRKGLVEEHYLYFRFMSNILAAPLAYAAHRLGLSANQITLTGAALLFPAGYFNLRGHYFSALLLFHLFFLLDCIDGILARGTKSSSSLGAYLDEMAHYLFDATFFFTLAAGIASRGDIVFSFIALSFYVLNTFVFRVHSYLLNHLQARITAHATTDLSILTAPLPDLLKDIILGSIAFPNVVLFMSAFAWNPGLLKLYLFYGCGLTLLYGVYTSAKYIAQQIRAGHPASLE